MNAEISVEKEPWATQTRCPRLFYFQVIKALFFTEPHRFACIVFQKALFTKIFCSKKIFSALLKLIFSFILE